MYSEYGKPDDVVIILYRLLSVFDLCKTKIIIIAGLHRLHLMPHRYLSGTVRSEYAVTLLNKLSPHLENRLV